MVIPPKVSRAVLITAAPSATDELFATALPPALRNMSHRDSWFKKLSRTFGDLRNDLVCSFFTNIVHYDICASGCVKQGVAANRSSAKGQGYHYG